MCPKWQCTRTYLATMPCHTHACGSRTFCRHRRRSREARAVTRCSHCRRRSSCRAKFSSGRARFHCDAERSGTALRRCAPRSRLRRCMRPRTILCALAADARPKTRLRCAEARKSHPRFLSVCSFCSAPATEQALPPSDRRAAEEVRVVLPMHTLHVH